MTLSTAVLWSFTDNFHSYSILKKICSLSETFIPIDWPILFSTLPSPLCRFGHCKSNTFTQPYRMANQKKTLSLEAASRQTAIWYWSLQTAWNRKWRCTLQQHNSHQVSSYVLPHQPMNLTRCIYWRSSEMPAKLCVAMDDMNIPKALGPLILWGYGYVCPCACNWLALVICTVVFIFNESDQVLLHTVLKEACKIH